MIWCCPLCKSSLTANASGLVCVNHHQFDRAKEGYVNLLPVQHKNSLAPGDSRLMLQQRRAFLGQGYYDELVDLLAELIRSESSDTNMTLLDSGCGEGYYLAQLREKLGLSTAYGLDISKDAVRLSAKADKLSSFVVASSFSMPVLDESVDCLLRVFSPGKAEEVSRVLKLNGLLIVVSPGAEHMRELKALLLERVDAHEPPALEQGFTLLQERAITFNNLLSAEVLMQLLGMTPLFWRVSPEKQQVLAALRELAVSADFIIRVYRKEQESQSIDAKSSGTDTVVQHKQTLNVWGAVDD